MLFLDSDDYLLPNAMNAFMNAIEAYREADYIKGGHKVFAQREVSSKFNKIRKEYANNLMSAEHALKNIVSGHNVVWNILFRKSFIDGYNLRFDASIRYYEDGPFTLSFFTHNPKCVYLNNETYVYRLGSLGSLTTTKISYSKCRSLIDGACTCKGLCVNLNTGIEFECQRTAASYYIMALKGLLRLKGKERIETFRYLRKNCKNIDGSYLTSKDRWLGRIYNMINIICPSNGLDS